MLVADDRVVLRRTGDTVTAHAPDPIRGLIEARGIGLLRAECADAVPLGLVVDLDRTETDRLPPPRSHVLLGLSFPCLHNSAYPAYAEAIGQYMTFGRYA